MQHYGCPTRLLDITTNPLAALYFACAGENDSDGAIYIFAVNKRDVRYANSDRVQMLATLAEFRASEQELLWNYELLNKKFTYFIIAFLITRIQAGYNKCSILF